MRWHILGAAAGGCFRWLGQARGPAPTGGLGRHGGLPVQVVWIGNGFWECAIGCSWVHEPPCRADDGVPSWR